LFKYADVLASAGTLLGRTFNFPPGGKDITYRLKRILAADSRIFSGLTQMLIYKEERMSSSRKEIFDALTCDSSIDGCDGDWRREILSNANPSDVTFIKEELSRDQGGPEKETFSRLRLEGKL